MAKKSKGYTYADDDVGDDHTEAHPTASAAGHQAGTNIVSEQQDVEPGAVERDPEQTDIYCLHTEGTIIDGVIYPIEGKEAPESMEVELTESRAAELQAGGVALSKKEENDTDTVRTEEQAKL